MRILVVEDDAVLLAVVTRSLGEAGHRVDAAADLDQARHFARVQPYDAILLDLNLPLSGAPHAGMGSGLTWLRELRSQGVRTPVMVLTARNRTDERIAGLNAGADDYVGKPFELAEVEARLDFAEYLGDSVKLHMDLDGKPFMAKVPEDRYTEIRGFEGKDVTASWSREDGHLLEQ